jgi:acyl carrier protein
MEAADQEQIATFVVQRFRAAIKGGKLGFDDPLVSTGIIDSFGVLEVIAFLEDTFGIVLDPTRLRPTEFETVNHIMALVERARRP